MEFAEPKKRRRLCPSRQERPRRFPPQPLRRLMLHLRLYFSEAALRLVHRLASAGKKVKKAKLEADSRTASH